MEPPTRLSTLEPVVCLECGAAYAKPKGGGTLSSNPGCPECGYLGWVHRAEPLTPARLRARSGADRPRRLSARAG